MNVIGFKSKNITGFSRLELSSYLKRSKIFFLTSLTEASGSRILLEALYVGLFCISNNIPGTEWLKNFDNGLLVENNNLDSISEVIKNFSNYEFSKDLAESNRDIIKDKYSTKIISNQYNEIYNKLTSN